MMTGMYQCRDIVSPGTVNLATRGLKKFVQGRRVSGRPVTPPYNFTYNGGENGELEGRPLDDELGGAAQEVRLAEEEERGGAALLPRSLTPRRHLYRSLVERPETINQSNFALSSLKEEKRESRTDRPLRFLL